MTPSEQLELPFEPALPKPEAPVPDGVTGFLVLIDEDGTVKIDTDCSSQYVIKRTASQRDVERALLDAAEWVKAEYVARALDKRPQVERDGVASLVREKLRKRLDAIS